MSLNQSIKIRNIDFQKCENIYQVFAKLRNRFAEQVKVVKWNMYLQKFYVILCLINNNNTHVCKSCHKFFFYLVTKCL